MWYGGNAAGATTVRQAGQVNGSTSGQGVVNVDLTAAGLTFEVGVSCGNTHSTVCRGVDIYLQK